MPLVAYHCAIVLFDKIVVCTNVYFVIAKESEAMPTDRLYIAFLSNIRHRPPWA